MDFHVPISSGNRMPSCKDFRILSTSHMSARLTGLARAMDKRHGTARVHGRTLGDTCGLSRGALAHIRALRIVRR